VPPRKRKPQESKAKRDCKLHCCTVPTARVVEIREDIKDWHAGQYAEERAYGPACHCGVAGAKEPCTRHG
jgi:hypothetical protein